MNKRERLVETDVERAFQFTPRWAAAPGEIVRQQWNFSPLQPRRRRLLSRLEPRADIGIELKHARRRRATLRRQPLGGLPPHLAARRPTCRGPNRAPDHFTCTLILSANNRSSSHNGLRHHGQTNDNSNKRQNDESRYKDVIQLHSPPPWYPVAGTPYFSGSSFSSSQRRSASVRTLSAVEAPGQGTKMLVADRPYPVIVRPGPGQ